MKTTDENGRRQWPIAVFLLGCLLFSWPVLALFDVPGWIAGVPALFAYLFAAWAALIVLIGLVSGRPDR
jgi:apolipoprotein N-acyltransferase